MSLVPPRMTITQRTSSRVCAILPLLLGLLLAGCGLVPLPNRAAPGPTPTPSATPDPSGYQSIAAESCLLADWSTLQAERRQSGTFYWQEGNLLAWRPGDGPPALAYLAPTDRSAWFTGALMLASGENFSVHQALAETVLVNGDLTWSPDGDWLAFVAFRPSESLYTVMALQPDVLPRPAPLDLFPADLARTDNRSARKAILGWRDNRTVQVVASCGEECRQGYDLRVTSSTAAAEPALTPTLLAQHQTLNEALRPETRQQTITPADFPSAMRSPYWSPDGSRIAYLDRRGLLWLLEPERKIHYILDIGLRDVYELRWSDGGDYLAVRAEDRAFIFQVPCQQAAP